MTNPATARATVVSTRRPRHTRRMVAACRAAADRRPARLVGRAASRGARAGRTGATGGTAGTGGTGGTSGTGGTGGRGCGVVVAGGTGSAVVARGHDAGRRLHLDPAEPAWTDRRPRHRGRLRAGHGRSRAAHAPSDPA